MKVADVLLEVEKIRKIRQLIVSGCLHDEHFREIEQLLMGYEVELLHKKIVE